MLVMASLMMADDLYETRQVAGAAGRRPRGRSRRPAGSEARPPAWQAGKTRRGHCRRPGASLDCEGGAARCVRQFIPGASKHLPRELALPGSWSRYLAPTCTRRLWEDETPTAMAAPHIPARSDRSQARSAASVCWRRAPAWDPALGRCWRSMCCAKYRRRRAQWCLDFGRSGKKSTSGRCCSHCTDAATDRPSGHTEARQPADFPALAARTTVMVPERFGTMRPAGRT